MRGLKLNDGGWGEFVVWNYVGFQAVGISMRTKYLGYILVENGTVHASVVGKL